MTFTDLEQTAKKKQTHQEIFLAKMDQVMRWAELEAAIEPVYPKPGNKSQAVGEIGRFSESAADSSPT